MRTRDDADHWLQALGPRAPLLTDEEAEDIRKGLAEGWRGLVQSKWLEQLLQDRDERRQEEREREREEPKPRRSLPRRRRGWARWVASLIGCPALFDRLADA